MLTVVVNCNSGISCCLPQTVGVCGTMIPTLKLFAYKVNKCKLNHINILSHTHTHWQIRTCVNIHVCCYHMYVCTSLTIKTFSPPIQTANKIHVMRSSQSSTHNDDYKNWTNIKISTTRQRTKSTTTTKNSNKRFFN